jgi:DNA end-binding protein Ku
MPQAVWTGDLSFGLVTIPVKLYTATTPKQVRFHQYEAGTGRRIRYARIAAGSSPDTVSVPSQETIPAPEPATSTSGETGAPDRSERRQDFEPDTQVDVEPDLDRNEAAPTEDESTEVPWEEVVKGYEIEPGRIVTVTADELAALAPERSRLLEIEQFVDLVDIDPVHFDKSYYVVPQAGRGIERPYWLLFRAMQASSKVAVGRFVMRTKEYLVAIRPTEHVLMLETLFYADEVRDVKETWRPLVEEPAERELEMARNLIEALAGGWDPARHRDEYRERLLELLHSKSDEALVTPAEPEMETALESITDLMKALEASVEAARQSRAEQNRQTG